MAWNPASIITLVRYKKGNIPLVPSKRVRKLKKQAKEQQQWIKDWLAELPKAENVVSPAKTPVVGPKAPGDASS